MKTILPFYVKGKVVKGFGRGSRSLGTPTANFDQSIVDTLPDALHKGIYFGWSQVDNGIVYPSVTSVGWNPVFQNQSKSMETYIMGDLPTEFYGSLLRVCLAGYIRDEQNFDGLDELKDAIRKDIETAKVELSKSKFLELKSNSFFNPKSIISQS